MKTEKTYYHWIARFFYFHQPENVHTFSTKEVHQYLEYLVLRRKHQLMAGLMYGGGLHLMECLTLRILDIDFDYNQLIIRSAKSFKDRVAPLPKRYIQTDSPAD